MKQRILPFAFGALACVGGLFAEETVVSAVGDVYLSGLSGADTVSVFTSAFADYPADMPTPDYWFDAKDRMGWSVDADGNVCLVPSKTGSRYLTNDLAGAGWTLWGATQPAKPAKLAFDEALGGYCLDFGALGSGCAMFFNPEPTAADPSEYKFSGVGTLILVHESSAGGGWMLGGCAEAPIGFHRQFKFSGKTDEECPYNTLAYTAENNLSAFYYGYSKHFGNRYIPYRVGFTGGWDVFSFSATNDAAAATLKTSGFGQGDARSSSRYRSGGFKIAEALVFHDVLDNETVTKIEKYLMKKWLGLSSVGENGQASLQNLVLQPYSDSMPAGPTVTIDAGETLSVGELVGGRNKSASASKVESVTVQGGGTVAISGAQNFGGEIRLENATLNHSAGARPIPTLAELPRGLYLRFDASVDSSLTTVTTNDGVSVKACVERVNNLTDWTNGGNPIYLSSEQGRPTFFDKRPYVVTDYSPTGLPVIDYGTFGNWGSIKVGDVSYRPARSLKINALGSPVTTVVVAMDPSNGGGWVMNSGFCRGTQTGQAMSTPLLCGQGPNHNGAGSNNVDKQNILSTTPLIVSGAEGQAWIDGERIANPTNTGYAKAGLQIVALQVPGCSPGYVGGYNENVSGGLAWGEMLVWARPLSEQEIRDASAYLALKWMGKALRGYAAPAGDATGVPDYQNIVAGADAKISVAAGDTMRVGKITVNGSLALEGEGVFEVEQVSSFNAASRLALGGGEVRFVAPRAIEANDEPAAGASLSFDPSDSQRWAYFAGSTAVSKVANRSDGVNVVGKGANSAPFLVDNAETNCNGRAYLDFGGYGNYADSWAGYPRALYFDKPLMNIRSIYMVWRQKPGCGAFLLGSGNAANALIKHGYWYDFHRSAHTGTDNESTQEEYLFGNNAAAAIRNGEMFVTGDSVTPDKFKPANDTWYLIEIHTTAGVVSSAIGPDRGSARCGGFLLGETLIYEHPLTEQEKVATRNYLLKKWFGKSDAELAELPAAPAKAADSFGTVAIADDTTLKSDGALTIAKVEGVGAFVKKGVGETTIVDPYAATGMIHVTEGTVKFVGHGFGAEPRLCEEGLGLWLDSQQGLTTYVDDKGVERIEEWESVLADGWKAVSPTGNFAGLNVTSYRPRYVAEPEFGGRKIVDMGGGTVSGAERSCFRFFKDGEWTPFGGIKTVLWVIGSHNGGGFLFGGGDYTGTLGYGTSGNAEYYAWHRGSCSVDSQSSGRRAADPLVSGSGLSTLRDRTKGAWRVNLLGVDELAENPFSGGWDLLSTRLDAGYHVPADGLAYDGRVFNGEDYRIRVGNMKLAELLVYTNRLTDAQLAETEAYLSAKWLVGGACSNAVAKSVVVDAGATLDCGDYAQTITSLAGKGTVVGDVTVGGVTAVHGETAGLTIDGTLTLGAHPVIDLVGFPDVLEDSETIPFASATAVAGLENLAQATVNGLPVGAHARIRVEGGNVFVRLSTLGAAIILR